MKIGEIPFGGSQTDKIFRENDFKKVVRNSEIFPQKCRNFFGGPRTETKFAKWSTTRKRLRTAALYHHANNSISTIGYLFMRGITLILTLLTVWYWQKKFKMSAREFYSKCN